MATLSKNDVLKLAQLARLHLSEAEVKNFQGEINEILGYVEKLQAVDVNGLEPTVQVTGLKNVMRDDVVRTYQALPEALLKGAPQREDSSLKVKRVL